MTGTASEGQPSLLYTLGRVHHGARREMRTALARLGLSVQEYTTLSVLRARPGLSNAQLARRALITPQSMIETIAKLETRGLVERRVDPGHARIRRAALTAAGKKLLARADPEIQAAQERIFGAIDPGERTVLEHALAEVMDALSDPRHR